MVVWVSVVVRLAFPVLSTVSVMWVLLVGFGWGVGGRVCSVCAVGGWFSARGVFVACLASAVVLVSVAASTALDCWCCWRRIAGSVLLGAGAAVGGIGEVVGIAWRAWCW